MDICGLIMARGGSQRVPNKSIRKFGNSSLLEIKINQLKQLSGLKEVYVNSDSDEILNIAESAGATTIKRDPYYATNDISINEVYKNLAESVPCEHILFAHLTSPLVKFDSLYKCFEIYRKLPNEYDSLATVTNIHKFMWYKDKAINYDPENMPRSQDLPDYYVLNFAFNILKRDLMINKKNIIGNNFYPYHLDELEAYDIDTEIEFKTAEYIYMEDHDE